MQTGCLKISLTLTIAGIIIIITLISGWLYHDANNFSFFNIPSTPTSAPITIQICIARGSGGMERCAVAQHKALIDAGINSILICRNHTFISDLAKQLQLPIITCSPHRLSMGKFVVMPGVEAALKKIISMFPDNKILAIHCHYKREIFAAKKVTKTIPVVLTQHTPSALAYCVRSTANGIVAVSPEIKAALEKQNKGELANHSTITVIPPFFDDAKFSSVIPPTNRNEFFKNQFNVTLKPCPLLVKIAHLYSNVQHKNHPLLFQAMRELIINRHIPVQVALAGKGPMLVTYKKMADDMGISDYVHFLGSTERTPELLHCADINLLASSEEALGIALIEGGLMKKPTIIAHGTGAADWLIADKQTGFLFEKNNAQSLADTIAYALKHEQEAAACGQRLYEKVVAEFMPTRSAQELITVYQKLAQNS